MDPEQEKGGPLFSRLRSVFKNSHHIENRPKNNVGREEKLTLEVWYKQADLYKGSKPLLSYLASGHCVLTFNVSSSTNLESVVSFLPLHVFFTVLSPWLLFFGANTKM